MNVREQTTLINMLQHQISQYYFDLFIKRYRLSLFSVAKLVTYKTDFLAVKLCRFLLLSCMWKNQGSW